MQHNTQPCKHLIPCVGYSRLAPMFSSGWIPDTTGSLCKRTEGASRSQWTESFGMRDVTVNK